MRFRLTLDISRSQPPEQDVQPDPLDYGTTNSIVELDGQADAGELKTHRLEPLQMGFNRMRKDDE